MTLPAPSEFVQVPREPTEVMMKAGYACDSILPLVIYREMLAAAPPCPGAGLAEEEQHPVSQKIRYYLKHQNLPSAWDNMTEFDRGVHVTCNNLEKIALEHESALRGGRPSRRPP